MQYFVSIWSPSGLFARSSSLLAMRYGAPSFQRAYAKHHAWDRLVSLLPTERSVGARWLQGSPKPSWLATTGLVAHGSVGRPHSRGCVASNTLVTSCAAEPSSRDIPSAKTAGGDTHKSESPRSLVISAGAYVLPHPDKVDKGGEDWYFIAGNRRAVGVADGVGGWSEVGVDAGVYARQLMRNAAAALSDGGSSSEGDSAQEAVLSAQEVLETACRLTTARGSATACVAVVNGDSLAVSNLGDSGLLILRGGSVVFHTPQQQHGFNFPYQIGSADSMSDSPSSAQRFVVALQPGDLIVLGTDGLWDNCFDEEVASVLKYCGDRAMDVAKMAQVLAHYARHRASDSKFASPFAYAAFQAGYAYMGGKMDDITVVVCAVEDPSPA